MLHRTLGHLLPDDEFDHQLASNVHPIDWTNPKPSGRYNLVVLGAGTAGLVTAAIAAGLGAKVALVERARMGGDCLNVGCVPSKGLISAARIAATVARAAEFGIEPGDARIDFGSAMERMRRLRALISVNDSAACFRKLGVDVYAQLGSEVFLVESEHGVLPREDRDAAEIVQNDRGGVTLLCCGRGLEIKGDPRVRLIVESHGRRYDERVGRLLVAVGRKPNVGNLNPETAGVAYDERGVTDDTLRTSNPRVYAAGDVCSSYQFTHAADFMARMVVQNALFHGRKKVSALRIPWCTYTSPEVAHVGLHEKQAAEDGIDIDTYLQPLADIDRAVLEGETAGFAKAHVRKGTDKIVGATVVARNAGDLIAEITLAMSHGLGLGKIGSTIHPYPTQAEAVRKLGDQYSRTRLTPRVASLVQRWLAWTR